MAETDLIQIVDENDNPTGVATIKEARTNGLIHRIARVMLENDKGEILLQKRVGKVVWPNCWDNSAAGHVDAGEDYLTAAKRELYEEIGVDNVALTELGTYFTEATNKKYIMKRFNRVYRIKSNITPTRLQPSEVTEVAWFSLPEVKSMIVEHPESVTDGLRDVISRYY